jgi:hypothetical protein
MGVDDFVDPHGTTSLARARRVCSCCPVLADCGDYAFTAHAWVCGAGSCAGPASRSRGRPRALVAAKDRRRGRRRPGLRPVRVAHGEPAQTVDGARVLDGPMAAGVWSEGPPSPDARVPEARYSESPTDSKGWQIRLLSAGSGGIVAAVTSADPRRRSVERRRRQARDPRSGRPGDHESGERPQVCACVDLHDRLLGDEPQRDRRDHLGRPRRVERGVFLHRGDVHMSQQGSRSCWAIGKRHGSCHRVAAFRHAGHACRGR